MDVNINQIQPNRYNPKTTEDHDKEYQAILAGIKEMGMKTPLDVREIEGDIPYEIIDGFHRWKACKELGWETMPITSWGKLDEQTAQKITILKEKAHIPLDLIKTSQIIKQLAGTTPLDVLVRQIGYTLPDLKADIELAGFSWDEYGKKGKPEEPKEGMRILTIFMAESQYEVIQRAIANAKSAGETDSDARALELICADYLAK